MQEIRAAVYLEDADAAELLPLLRRLKRFKIFRAELAVFVRDESRADRYKFYRLVPHGRENDGLEGVLTNIRQLANQNRIDCDTTEKLEELAKDYARFFE